MIFKLWNFLFIHVLYIYLLIYSSDIHSLRPILCQVFWYILNKTDAVLVLLEYFEKFFFLEQILIFRKYASPEWKKENENLSNIFCKCRNMSGSQEYFFFYCYIIDGKISSTRQIRECECRDHYWVIFRN